MEQRSRVIRYYNSTASDYKRFWMGADDEAAMHFGYYDTSVKSHLASLLKMNEILAGYAGIKAGDQVLDAGCGYGGSAIWLARLGCQVIGVTVVPEQVEEARKRAERLGLGEQARFFERDYCDTAFPDASFDVVWAVESLVHTNHKPAFLQEAHRLLRPGGRLLIAEYMLREHPPLTNDERAQLTDWLTGWAMPELLTVGEYSFLLEECGFTQVRTMDITKNIRPSVNHLGKLYLPTLPTANIAVLLARGASLLGWYNRDRVSNIEAGICQNKALRRGFWHYIVLYAEK